MEDLPEPSNQLDTVQIAEKFNHARTSDLETKGNQQFFFLGGGGC